MSPMTKEDLKTRTKQFALGIIHLTNALPDTPTARVITNQLLRAGTFVGANYRAALRARSQRDFGNKIGVVLEEADETIYWIELIVESDLLPPGRVADLLKEANELTAIFAATHKIISPIPGNHK